MQHSRVVSAVIVGTLAIAFVVGTVISEVPLAIAGLGAALASAVAVGLLMRRVLSTVPDDHVVFDQPTSTPEVKSDRLGTFLFYGGCMTMALLIVRPFAGLTLSDLLFAASLLVVFVTRAFQRRPIRLSLPTDLVIGLTVFSLGAVISSFASPEPIESLVALAKFLYIFLGWAWVAKELLDTPPRLWIATRLWLVSGAFAGAAALLQTYANVQIPGAQSSWGRVSGLTGNVNDLGAVCSIALVVAVATLERQQRRRAITLQLGICILLLSGLILSGSVGSMLAACVGLAFWVITSQRLGRNLTVVLAGGLLVIAFLLSVPQDSLPFKSPLYRLLEVSGQTASESSVESRLENYRVAWNAMNSSPFIGHGLDSMGRRTEQGQPVHNLFLGSFYESGLVGLVGILVVVLSVFATGASSVRNSAAPERTLQLALLSGFLAFLAYSMSGPTLYQRYGWISAILLLASLSAIPSQRSVKAYGTPRGQPMLQHVTPSTVSRRSI